MGTHNDGEYLTIMYLNLRAYKDKIAYQEKLLRLSLIESEGQNNTIKDLQLENDELLQENKDLKREIGELKGSLLLHTLKTGTSL